MADPVITTALELVAVAVEAMQPAHGTSRFTRIKNGSDPRRLPLKGCERQFRIVFRELQDLSAEAEGVISAGCSDREVTANVEVAYPAVTSKDSNAIDARLAEDAELVQRTLSRAAWTSTIARVLVKTTREQAGEIVVLVHALRIQYRDA